MMFYYWILVECLYFYLGYVIQNVLVINVIEKIVEYLDIKCGDVFL